MNMVFGLFNRYDNLQLALQVLESYDTDRGSISIVAQDKDVSEPGAGDEIVGLLTGQNAIAFIAPGIGPAIATGALAITWFNKLGGTSTGGLLGVLLFLGLSVKEAEFYEEGVGRGGILVAVETSLQNERRIRAILLGAGSADLKTQPPILRDESGDRFGKVKMA